MWVQVGLGVIDGRKLEEGSGLEPSAVNQIERHHTLTHTLTQPRNEQLHRETIWLRTTHHTTIPVSCPCPAPMSTAATPRTDEMIWPASMVKFASR